MVKIISLFLKSAVFIGYGPDTFAMYFPQHDISGKVKAYGTDDIIVDKPHNMYLQNAVNTGILSLLAFLVMIISYFLSSIKLYKSPISVIFILFPDLQYLLL